MNRKQERVIVVMDRNGNLVKVCNDKNSYREWLKNNEYIESKLKTRNAAVYKSSN
jgi:hypothetical protein